MSQAPPEGAGKTAAGPKYQPLVIVLAAVSAGIVADRRWGLPLAVWWSAAGGGLIVWLALWRCGRIRSAAVVLLLAAASAAAAWHHCRWQVFAEDDLGSFARGSQGPACVEAVVTKGPRRTPAPEPNPLRPIPVGESTRLEVEVTGIRDGARWRAASGVARLDVDGHLLGVQSGDRLRIFARLTAPGPRMNPGEFDYAAYARADRRRGHLSTTFPDCVTVLDRGGWWGPRRWIETVRAAGDRMLWKHLDRRRSALAAAVLLGAREELGSQWSEAFVETGTVHLMAISGLHVGIVVAAVLLLMRLLCVRRDRAVLVVALVAVCYTLLTDARPPTVRATILVLVMCAGHYLGRQRLAFNSLAAAALVVLVLNPADLFNTGVQLSFLAVAALMWFAPGWFGTASEPYNLQRMMIREASWLRRMLWFVWRSVRHLTLVSFTIWVVLTPLLMARFHLVTPAAVVLNTLLWLPMAVALVSGFGVLAFGWLVPPLGAVFGFCCDRSLWFLQCCVELARDVPGSHSWVPGPTAWWLAGFYGGLALWATIPIFRPPRRWCLALVGGWTAIGLTVPLVRGDPNDLDCTFLSAGHGLAVVLQLPSGGVMLYDAGQFSSPEQAARSIADCLWSRGITHLDAVVLSHPDIDHYNAMPELLERFSVGVIYVSPLMFMKENLAMVALEGSIHRAGVPLKEIFAGDQLNGGEGCRIEVLHPPRHGVLGGDNANSVTLAVEYLGRRILLTGDLESPGLESVMAELPWDCDVLLAPHHGSRRSNPPGLAAWSRPEWVVISGPRWSDLEETAAAYRAVGAEVLYTGRHGAVGVTIDAGRVTVEGFLGSR